MGKYREADLTEALKVFAYLRLLRIYAAILLSASVLYLLFKTQSGIKGTELYLVYCLTGFSILGSLSFIINVNRKTAVAYGVSAIGAGAIFLFSLLYYGRQAQTFFMALGVIVGLILLKHGAGVAFGHRSHEAFSKTNQKKISFIKTLLKSMKRSPPDADVIHCTYKDDGTNRNLSIKFVDDVACFLLESHAAPTFIDRKDVYFSELERNRGSLNLSIIAYNNDWLEAQMKTGDYEKYEAWKE